MGLKIPNWIRGVFRLQGQQPPEVEDDYQTRVPFLQEIQKKLETGEMLSSKLVVPLTEADYLLIGRVIQLYCMADFHARSAIVAITEFALQKKNSAALTLNDTDVLIRLKKIAREWVKEDVVKDGIVRAVEALEAHRIHRHNFAHWVVQRYVDEDVFVFLTRNAKEAEKRDGQPQMADEVKYGVVIISHLEEEMKKLQGHSEYLHRVVRHYSALASKLS